MKAKWKSVVMAASMYVNSMVLLLYRSQVKENLKSILKEKMEVSTKYVRHLTFKNSGKSTVVLHAMRPLVEVKDRYRKHRRKTQCRFHGIYQFLHHSSKITKHRTGQKIDLFLRNSFCFTHHRCYRKRAVIVRLLISMVPYGLWLNGLF